jgi:hypothetical protein
MSGSNWLFEIQNGTTVDITQGATKDILTTKGTEAVTAKKRKKGKTLVAAEPVRIRIKFPEHGPPQISDLPKALEER